MEVSFYNNCSQTVCIEIQGEKHILRPEQKIEIPLCNVVPETVSVTSLEKRKGSCFIIIVKSIYEYNLDKNNDVIEIYREKYKNVEDNVEIVRLVLVSKDSKCKTMDYIVEQKKLKNEWFRYKINDIYAAHLWGFFLDIFLPLLVIAIIHELILSRFRWDILFLIIGAFYILTLIFNPLVDVLVGKIFRRLFKKQGVPTSCASLSQVKKKFSSSYILSYFSSDECLSEMKELDRNFDWVRNH